MRSKIGGSRQAHDEKVAEGRRNEALLTNGAAAEDISQQTARNRQRQADATSDNAMLVRLTTCRLAEASLAELEEFLRCYSKTVKQIVSERTWNCLAKGRPPQSRCWRPQATALCRTSPAVAGHRGSRSCVEARTCSARPCSACVRTWRTG